MKTGMNLFLITLLSLTLFACSGTGSTTSKEDDRINRLQFHDSSLTLADYLVRVGGVTVQNRDGQTTVRIRGNLSFNAPADPLYVIDGIRSGHDYDRVERIVPVDSILSVQVLKGADASTRYGMDGSNGAIVIRTKHNE